MIPQAELLKLSNWLWSKSTLHLMQCDTSCLHVFMSSWVEYETELSTFHSAVVHLLTNVSGNVGRRYKVLKTISCSPSKDTERCNISRKAIHLITGSDIRNLSRTHEISRCCTCSRRGWPSWNNGVDCWPSFLMRNCPMIVDYLERTHLVSF
jgi:hypothetical protein